jgi:hypothetical protein
MLSGRKAEAARNDQRISAAARAVFVADPGAPVAAVAKAAGVRFGDAERARGLRRRYLALVLEALRAPGAGPLPGSPPSWRELSSRWDG